jgi:hypothetical protein
MGTVARTVIDDLRGPRSITTIGWFAASPGSLPQITNREILNRAFYKPDAQRPAIA